jgi:hypothetical protein
MSDDESAGPEGFAFGVPISIPREIAHAIASQHERQHMRQDAAIMEMQNFLESLNPSQLWTLRKMLCMDGDSASNQFYDGQIYQIMRLVHHVDPDTGQSFDEQLGTGKP